VRWSPNGKKFAVGSGSKQIPVCHYEKSQDIWVAKMIKKAGKSTVSCIDWSPNNLFLIAGGCDFRCRIFSAWIPVVDDEFEIDKSYGGVFDDKLDDKKQCELGTCLAEFDQSCGWIEACRFSPNGLRFAFAGHDSTVNIGDIKDGKIDIQTIIRRDLPIRTIVFLNDNLIIGGGYECVPIVYEYKNNSWQEKGALDTGKTSKSKQKQGGGAFASSMTMWQQKSNLGQENGAVEDIVLPFRHQNIINDIVAFDEKQFSTSGIDGRVLIWDVTKSY
jgi:actin related protein 2/3 complex subunit 1A/1B